MVDSSAPLVDTVDSVPSVYFIELLCCEGTAASYSSSSDARIVIVLHSISTLAVTLFNLSCSKLLKG